MSMSDDTPNLKIERLKSAINSTIGRFLFTTAATLVASLIMRDSLQKDPNALKWLLITIWVDVTAYLFGYINGYKGGVFGLYDALMDSSKNDIIGGKGDRHEE
jgi:hypothetical protein